MTGMTGCHRGRWRDFSCCCLRVCRARTNAHGPGIPHHHTAATRLPPRAQVEVAVQKDEHKRGKLRLQALRKDLSASTRQLKLVKQELKQADLTAAREQELKKQAAKLAAKIEQLCEAEEAAVQVLTAHH